MVVMPFCGSAPQGYPCHPSLTPRWPPVPRSFEDGFINEDWEHAALAALVQITAKPREQGRKH
jgi:hypothetical protein